MSDFISISICLSDLPKDKIKDAKGRKYINLSVSRMKQPDNYGQTHTVFVSQTKDERDAKEDRIYVGKGKEINFNSSATPAVSIPEPATPADDDLPF